MIYCWYWCSWWLRRCHFRFSLLIDWWWWWFDDAIMMPLILRWYAADIFAWWLLMPLRWWWWYFFAAAAADYWLFRRLLITLIFFWYIADWYFFYFLDDADFFLLRWHWYLRWWFIATLPLRWFRQPLFMPCYFDDYCHYVIDADDFDYWCHAIIFYFLIISYADADADIIDACHYYSLIIADDAFMPLWFSLMLILMPIRFDSDDADDDVDFWWCRFDDADFRFISPMFLHCCAPLYYYYDAIIWRCHFDADADYFDTPADAMLPPDLFSDYAADFLIDFRVIVADIDDRLMMPDIFAFFDFSFFIFADMIKYSDMADIISDAADDADTYLRRPPWCLRIPLFSMLIFAFLSIDFLARLRFWFRCRTCAQSITLMSPSPRWYFFRRQLIDDAAFRHWSLMMPSYFFSVHLFLMPISMTYCWYFFYYIYYAITPPWLPAMMIDDYYIDDWWWLSSLPFLLMIIFIRCWWYYDDATPTLFRCRHFDYFIFFHFRQPLIMIFSPLLWYDIITPFTPLLYAIILMLRCWCFAIVCCWPLSLSCCCWW